MKKKEKVLQKEQWATAAWDMLYLVQCGVNSVVPDPQRIAKMDLEKVYARSKSQSLEVIAYMALESLTKSNPQAQILDISQVLPQWQKAKDKAIAKNLMMDEARKQLFAFLEERGIWHVALKGAVLCYMYPKYGMRQMADNDILFDPLFRQEVHDWFVAQGYEVENFQKSNHDEYHKKPAYNFEMHVALFKEYEQPQLAQYYLTIKEKLLQKPGTGFEYSMTDEDFYLYIIAHEYKHWFYKGTGLRSLVDLYVYNKFKNGMDRDYLNEQMHEMNIFEFESEMRKLAFNVLDSEVAAEEMSEKEQKVLEELLYGSTYGTRQRSWINQIQRLQLSKSDCPINIIKLQYLMRRLFPDKDHMEIWCQTYAPYFLHYQRLMPAAWFLRILKGVIEKNTQIKEEIHTIRKV